MLYRHDDASYNGVTVTIRPTAKCSTFAPFVPFCPDASESEAAAVAFLEKLETYRRQIECDTLDEAFIYTEIHRDVLFGESGERSAPPYFRTDHFLDCSVQGTDTIVLNLEKPTSS